MIDLNLYLLDDKHAQNQNRSIYIIIASKQNQSSISKSSQALQSTKPFILSNLKNLSSKQATDYMTSPFPPSNTTTTNQKTIQSEIASAVRYFKSQFPTSYQEWKFSFQGEKSFQKHLNVIEYTFGNERYFSLRGRILDQVLIKFRFIVMNQSYLERFEAFLLEKFIRFIVRSLGVVFKLESLYSREGKTNEPNRQQQKMQVFERYSILLECLAVLIKFCFNTSSSTLSPSSNSSSFSSQTTHLSSSSNSLIQPPIIPSIQLASKAFVLFVLQTLSQKLQQIFTYNIMNVRNIYPQFFSILSEGFLNYKGGSKVLEVCGDLIVGLVEGNKGNIWGRLAQGDEESNREKQLDGLRRMNQEIASLLSKKQELTQSDLDQIKEKHQLPPSSSITTQNKFHQICKQRLLLLLQTLLMKAGYNVTKNQHIEQVDLMENQMLVSPNKVAKLGRFVGRLLEIVEGSCFQVGQESEKQRGNGSKGQSSSNHQSMRTLRPITLLQPIDTKILYSLILLAIEFIPQEPQPSPTHSNKKYSNPTTLLLSHFLFHPSPSFSHFLTNPTTQTIRQNISELFLDKFKVLINKNKTISSSKTCLLKQLAKIVRFVSFENMGGEGFQLMVCEKLKGLFKPTEHELNKPIIIAIDQRNRVEDGVVGILTQPIPLTQLLPIHSFATYPINLPSLQQSLQSQESRHLLNQVKLFNWFQHEQCNLKQFKQLITHMDFMSKLALLEYFLDDLLKMKLEDTPSVYGLEMSLKKFYSLLVDYFFVDLLLGWKAGEDKDQWGTSSNGNSNRLLDLHNYTLYTQLYHRTIIPKLQTLYSMITTNTDLKRLLITSKQEQLLIFWNIRIMSNISKFFLLVQVNTKQHKKSHKLKILHRKCVIAENLILNLSHETYLLKLLVITCLIEFAAPCTIAQCLKPLQSTLIHRNAGSSLTNRTCNLQFIRNLIKICHLKPKQAEELAEIYLSKSFITNSQANFVVSLIFTQLKPETMRKCILSIRNWPVIFSVKRNLMMLNNQPLVQQAKEELFHANDGDNVTVANALGVIALQLNEKWTAELEFTNPRKQILIDAMVNLIETNDKLIFWKRFFFQTVLVKLTSILNEIEKFVGNENTENNRSKNSAPPTRRHLLYSRIHTKIFKLISLIPLQFYKYSTQINKQIRENLQSLRAVVEKQHAHLKRQCFVYQRYEQYLEKYKQSNLILEKIDTGLAYNEDDKKDQGVSNKEGAQK